MSGVRADWRLAEAVAEVDPFEAVVYTSGVEIDLTAPEAELSAKLMELCALEAELFNRGIKCKLKADGQNCNSCVHGTLDPARRLSGLCRVGKDQETVWRITSASEDARMGPLREVALVADEMSEIGYLTPELADFLVGAGM
jgi:hypothetical protein